MERLRRHEEERLRLIHADKAVLQVENYRYATSQLAQTTLRSEIGKIDLDRTFEPDHLTSLYIPELSDHGHWAIVDRAGSQATYNYGFN